MKIASKKIDGFADVHGDFRIGIKSVEKRSLLEFCVEKGMFVGNSCFEKKDNRLLEGVVVQK